MSGIGRCDVPSHRISHSRHASQGKSGGRDLLNGNKDRGGKLWLCAGVPEYDILRLHKMQHTVGPYDPGHNDGRP